jgi:hypothetical protein
MIDVAGVNRAYYDNQPHQLADSVNRDWRCVSRFGLVSALDKSVKAAPKKLKFQRA